MMKPVREYGSGKNGLGRGGRGVRNGRNGRRSSSRKRVGPTEGGLGAAADTGGFMWSWKCKLLAALVGIIILAAVATVVITSPDENTPAGSGVVAGDGDGGGNGGGDGGGDGGGGADGGDNEEYSSGESENDDYSGSDGGEEYSGDGDEYLSAGEPEDGYSSSGDRRMLRRNLVEATQFPTRAPTGAPVVTPSPSAAPVVMPTQPPRSALGMENGRWYNAVPDLVMGGGVPNEPGPAANFGHLYKVSSMKIRTLVADFEDRSEPLLGLDGSEVTDAVFQQTFQDKFDLWSNGSFAIEPNGAKAIERVLLDRKFRSRPACKRTRQLLVREAKRLDPTFITDSDEFNFYAAVCFRGEMNGAQIELAKGDLASFFNEFSHKLGWSDSGIVHLTRRGMWSHWARNGDLLTSSGGMVTPKKGFTHVGPEGFLPIQKHAFGWMNPSDYVNLVPGQTYRLRTVSERTLTGNASSYPSALVWRDRVYDTDVWFSFYDAPEVFDEYFVDLHGSENIHGDGFGFAAHVPANNGASSLRVGLFGKDFVHHNGLRFHTVAHTPDYVDVRVDYDRTLQRTWIPTLRLRSKSRQKGSRGSASTVRVQVKLAQTFNEPDVDPFSITENATIVCPWATFTGSKSSDSFVTIAPQKKNVGSEFVLRQKRYASNTEDIATYVDVAYISKGKLSRAESRTEHQCTLHLGNFLEKDIRLKFD